MKKIIILFVFIFSFLQTFSFDIASLWEINSSVIDKVWILKPEEKTKIETQIAELRKKYTVEILTVIIPTTDGEDISSVATQIWQKIWVWKSDKDNGLVLLIAINDRAWNIATGYWVEWVLPDLLTKKIWEKNFVLFRDGEYFQWISGALKDFWLAFEWDESIISLQKENSSTKSEDNWWILIFQFILAIIFSSIFLKPLEKQRKYEKLFLYLWLAYIITLPLAYLLVQNAFFFLENVLIWLFWSIFWIYGKSWKWWSSWGGFKWWWGSSGWWFWGFWWWRFGGWWSSWKW